VISLRRPSAEAIERFHRRQLDLPDSAERGPTAPEGFHHGAHSEPIGSGAPTFERAADGLRRWIPQRCSGVDVHPTDAPVEPGSVVTLVTRQAGACLMFSCRVHDVVEEPDRFGFTYVTLPGHPEQGWETFTVRRDPATGEVTFEIDVVWRPAILLSKLAGPFSQVLQRRATASYFEAMRDWVRSA
jgi:uncharacterized protein (UPF0548 family)